jgi:hypothetical protein
MIELPPDEFDPVEELRRATIVARLEEINLLTEAGVRYGMREDPNFVAYILVRAVTLGIQLGKAPEDGSECGHP